MKEITTTEFERLSDYIKDNYGIYLKSEKKALLTGRLRSVVEQSGFDSFTDYYTYVVADKTGAAATELADRISTNYSFFMRETAHFQFLRDVLLPRFEKNLPDRDFRIWSAGCATGEEPYTLSFILNDFFEEKRYWDKTVLATDISERALRIAATGSYSKKQIEPLPYTWQLKYMRPVEAGMYHVREEIKKEIHFGKFNLVTDNFGFRKPFHVIFLRNVMIYFDTDTRIELLRKMYEVTARGGYLFLGHSEAIGPEESQFKYVMPAVYRKL